MTKGQGISFFAAVIAFAVSSVLCFILPIEKNMVFWMGYTFVVYSLIVMLVSLIKFFKKQVKEEQVLNVPVVVASWIYLVLQICLSIVEISTSFFSYIIALIVNLIVGLVFTVIILSLAAAKDKISENDARVIEKILFIDNLKNELKRIDTDDAVLQKKVNGLIDDITYSDPMTHSKLSEIEGLILEKTKELSRSVTDIPLATELCDEISKLMKQRNDQCLSLKRVKDSSEIEGKTSKGNKIAVIGIGVALCIVLAVATVVLYIAPEMQYKDACELADEEKYEEALKIFSNLNGYKDSSAKIEEIETIIKEQKYNQAENAFSNGDYDKALGLYRELDGYKDSRDRIIEIKNRQSTKDIMYLGTYNNEPIAWKIVEFRGYDEALLLAEQPIRDLPISDDIADIPYKNSEIAKWLDNNFMSQFTDKDLSKIIVTNGEKAYLLSESEVKELKDKGVDLTSKSDWWICTEGKNGFKYVTQAGEISTSGDIHLRDKGVRPAMWINLK